MAAVRLRSEFLCSICLDMFTQPVTTSCGHTYCKSCITEHWRVNAPYRCPMCNEVFNTKPELKISTIISAMVAQIRHEDQRAVPTKTQAEFQQMIQERRRKIQEIQQSMELSQNAADRVTAEGVQVFTAMRESIDRGLEQFKEEVQEMHRPFQKKAADFIKELDLEICELDRRSAEVEQLSGSEDHPHSVQRVSCFKAASPMKTWTKVSACPPSYDGMVARAMSELEDKLREDRKKVAEAELRRVQSYAVDLTLDPDTAHSGLILSADWKEVRHSDKRRKLPRKRQRFSEDCCVLARQSFSRGRFYFEVQVRGKTNWALGVARESINRKGDIPLYPVDGSWTIWLMDGNQYHALDDPRVFLAVKSDPEKVGVFVDYEEGLVSFYDVNSSALIYSFVDCSFNEKVLPFFSPCLNEGGTNSAPMILTPVNTEEEMPQM